MGSKYNQNISYLESAPVFCNNMLGAGKMAQSMKWLLHKYEDLSSDPQPQYEKPSVVVQGLGEIGRSLKLTDQPV